MKIRQLLASLLLIAQGITLFGFTQEGTASWYGEPFHKRKTANGEIFDMNSISAAHKTLPFGTIVHVQNLDNGKTLDVRINDRGPFVKDRIIDLSKRAAEELGIIDNGTAHVQLTAEDSVFLAEENQLMTIQVAAYKLPLNAKKMKEKITRAQMDAVGVLTTEGVIRIEIRNVERNKVPMTLAKLQELGITSPVVKKQV